MKVLIIDDSNVVEAISLCLQLRWPEVTISSATDGIEGMRILESESFNIVILDNPPDIDCFEFIKQIRLWSNIPIILLTLRGGEADQARGLEMGADDYIVKPFRPRDLIARVNALLRRTRLSTVTTEEHSVVRGKLSLNLATYQVQFGEEIIKLTPNECKVLYFLMGNAGKIVSSQTILREALGRKDTNTDLVRTYISRLRDKLKDKPPQIILSKHGDGYQFVTLT